MSFRVVRFIFAMYTGHKKNQTGRSSLRTLDKDGNHRSPYMYRTWPQATSCPAGKVKESGPKLAGHCRSSRTTAGKIIHGHEHNAVMVVETVSK